MVQKGKAEDILLEFLELGWTLGIRNTSDCESHESYDLAIKAKGVKMNHIQIATGLLKYPPPAQILRDIKILIPMDQSLSLMIFNQNRSKHRQRE